MIYLPGELDLNPVGDIIVFRAGPVYVKYSFWHTYYVFMWTYSYSTVLAPKYVTVYTVLEKLSKMFSLQGGYYLHELFETEINGFFSQKL